MKNSPRLQKFEQDSIVKLKYDVKISKEFKHWINKEHLYRVCAFLINGYYILRSVTTNSICTLYEDDLELVNKLLISLI